MEHPVLFIPKRNYPENTWWVAGFSDEITDKPLRRIMLDHAVVLFRTESGKLVALEDRCVHRWAPLSQGTVDGENIACPYHGMKFGPDGKCVHIPTQSQIPTKAQVRSFPILESSPFVWIWMGDPNQMKPLPAALPWTADITWMTVKGTLPIKCNYMLLQENVLDLTHFAFLHATTLKQPGWEAKPEEVMVEDGRVGYRHVFANIKLAPFQAIPTGIGSEKEVRRTDWGDFVSPALHVAGIDIIDPNPTENSRSEFAARIVHATTPVNATSSHYWWTFSQDYAVSDVDVTTKVAEIIDATFAEDKLLLEIIQNTVDHDIQHDKALEVSLGADRLGLQARRVVDGLIAADRTTRK